MLGEIEVEADRCEILYQAGAVVQDEDCDVALYGSAIIQRQITRPNPPWPGFPRAVLTFSR